MRNAKRKATNKNVFAVPLPTHFKPPYPKLFWHFWKKMFLPHFHQKVIIFSLSNNERGKHINCPPTYLPNQNIQGRDIANKHFKEDLRSASYQ